MSEGEELALLQGAGRGSGLGGEDAPPDLCPRLCWEGDQGGDQEPLCPESLPRGPALPLVGLGRAGRDWRAGAGGGEWSEGQMPTHPRNLCGEAAA